MFGDLRGYLFEIMFNVQFSSTCLSKSACYCIRGVLCIDILEVWRAITLTLTRIWTSKPYFCEILTFLGFGGTISDLKHPFFGFLGNHENKETIKAYFWADSIGCFCWANFGFPLGEAMKGFTKEIALQTFMRALFGCLRLLFSVEGFDWPASRGSLCCIFTK